MPYLILHFYFLYFTEWARTKPPHHNQTNKILGIFFLYQPNLNYTIQFFFLISTLCFVLFLLPSFCFPFLLTLVSFSFLWWWFVRCIIDFVMVMVGVEVTIIKINLLYMWNIDMYPSYELTIYIRIINF